MDPRLVWSGVDIRTKLVFALVAVSLGSMFALGAVVSPRVEGYIRDGTLQQLDQLAEARLESLRWILAGWREGAELVASRTQLRASLDEHVRTADPGDAERIRAILADAIAASRSATLLEVYDPEGQSVASVRRRAAAPAMRALDQLESSTSSDAVYAGVTVGEGTAPQVTFLVPMTWERRVVGRLLAVFAAPELLELTGNYHGLGETGETLVVIEDEAGRVRTLHPTRHDGGLEVGVLPSSGPGALGERALSGETDVLAGGVRDYRDQEVWAATRLVQETGWGVVVKVDHAEGLQRVVEFEEWLRRTALVLAAFAIVLGLVLALRLALPIHALAETANRIREGEMGARADVVREDEVGLLARTFNDMADELEERMERLRQFRKFFDVTIDLMCIAGTDGYFKLTNPAFERELGWSQEELLERPFFDFVHPDDIAKTQAEVAKLAQGIPTISFENRFVCRDGTYRCLRWTSFPDQGVLYAIARVIDESASA